MTVPDIVLIIVLWVIVGYYVGPACVRWVHAVAFPDTSFERESPWFLLFTHLVWPCMFLVAVLTSMAFGFRRARRNLGRLVSAAEVPLRRLYGLPAERPPAGCKCGHTARAHDRNGCHVCRCDRAFGLPHATELG